MPKDVVVLFGVLVVGRAEAGKEHGVFEASGLAYWAGGQVVVKMLREAGGGLEVSGGERLRLLYAVRAVRRCVWVGRVELAEVGF